MLGLTHVMNTITTSLLLGFIVPCTNDCKFPEQAAVR